jgi:Uma2 family endonuclease
MATATPPVESKTRPLVAEQRIVLRGVGWAIYEALLQTLEGQSIRLTYDRGDIELMAPSYDHEHYKKLMGRFIETVTEELDMPCSSAGSTTWRKQVEDRGLEPDDCFYLSSLAKVAGRTPDLSVDPPPDLALEIEISRSMLDRMTTYAALRVPEVWRFDGETLHIYLLQTNGTYAPSSTSLNFPFLSPHEVESWLAMATPMFDQTPWIRQIRDWVRAEVAPRLDADKPTP